MTSVRRSLFSATGEAAVRSFFEPPTEEAVALLRGRLPFLLRGGGREAFGGAGKTAPLGGIMEQSRTV